MKALITSGGRGTRLRPLTHTQNKHLIPIANKPILHYAIEYAVEAGITEIGIVHGAESDAVPKGIGDGSKWGINITYIAQDAPSGLAHVVKISEDFIGKDKFIFYLGDNIVVGGLRKFVNAFEEAKSNCHLTLAKVDDPERFGVPEIQGNRIVSVEEKPKNPKSHYAVAGIYLYDNSIFEAVNNIEPSARGELEISDAHQYLLDKNFHVSYSEITGWWKDTGKPQDLLEANRLVLDSISEDNKAKQVENSSILGNVQIGKGSVIKNSSIRGPVVIGKNCVIDDAYIGPYTAIYNDCTIKNSEVEYSILLSECKIIDVNIRIEHSLLGNDVEIVKAESRPSTHRFFVGDQSRIELL
jgi:glucose-1-phosphate thymidylyltransferase